MAAVGIRPCSGALIVLTFAFLNGLWFGGILSVLAMAVGTAITVSILATLAVTAKNWAVALAGDGRTGNAIHATIEIGGAGAGHGARLGAAGGELERLNSFSPFTGRRCPKGG